MKKNIHTTMFFCLATLALCSHVQAVVVDDLYSTTVQVADKSEALRGSAISQSLGDVLVKLTGSRAVLRDPGVVDILRQAQRYVIEYGYSEQASVGQKDGAIDRLAPDASAVAASVRLHVSFESRAVQAVLRDLILPIWPADRPAVMLWLVANTAEGYQFIEFTDDSDVSVQVEAMLVRRGMPFKSPLYDLQDQMALSPEQAWLGNEAQLTEATHRYGLDHWMVLRVPDAGSNLPEVASYQGGWFMGGRKERLSGSASGQSILRLLDDSVAQAVDRFSLGFTYRARKLAEAVHLLITDVDNYQDFSAVTTLLSGLEVVESTQVTQIQQDQLYLDVITEGDVQVLLRALDINGQLSRVVDISDGLDQALFRYQLRTGSP